MRIVEVKEFLDMPEGTVFAFGPAFAFGGLLIKEETIRADKYFGFWACDPCWVSAGDCGDAFNRLDGMRNNGASYPMDDSVSKYMSYDGDDMECFIIFEQSDLDRLKEIMGGGKW